jgi:SPP1 family predicted phage head-tail adaptor
MRSGRLRARIVFQTERRVEDASGGAEPGTWRTVAAARGEYIPERGREAIAAGHLQGSNLAVLRVRFQKVIAAIDTSARCLINDEIHQIRSMIDPDQRRRILEMVVERDVAPFS